MSNKFEDVLREEIRMGCHCPLHVLGRDGIKHACTAVERFLNRNRGLTASDLLELVETPSTREASDICKPPTRVYLVVPWPKPYDAASLALALKHHGEDGWQFVSAEWTEHDGDTGTERVLVFQRQA